MANDCCFSEEEICRYVSCDMPDERALLLEEHLEKCDLCQQRLVAEVGAGCTPTWLKQYAQCAEEMTSLSSVGQPGVAATQTWRCLDTGKRTVAEPVRHQLPLTDDSFDSQIDSFQLVRCIAKGGMSEVYEAFDTVTLRPVALKVMRSACNDHYPLQRIMTEAQALARLSHPQIVAVHDVISYRECPVLVLEYVSGPTLESWQGKQLVHARLAAKIVRDLALAVSHAHERGVVHRDLKPANVMLNGELSFEKNNRPDADLQLKVTDFGISRLLDRDPVTQTGEVLGTPAYMAPERTKGQTHQLGPSVDIYGLGAILYELLTGRPPFVSADPIVTLALVRDSEPISPKALRPDLPIDLNTICLKCLEKRPDQRYESAQGLANELSDFLADRLITARPLSIMRRSLRWCRRNRGLSAALSIAMLGLLSTLITAILFARMQSGLRHEADVQRQRTAAAEKQWQSIAERRQQHLTQLQHTVLDYIHSQPAEGSESHLTREVSRQQRLAIAAQLQEYCLTEIGSPSEWTEADLKQILLYNQAVADTIFADNALPWLEKGEQSLELMAARGHNSFDVDEWRGKIYESQAWHAARKQERDRFVHYSLAAVNAWKASLDREPDSASRMDSVARSYGNLIFAYHQLGDMSKSSETTQFYTDFLQSWFRQRLDDHKIRQDYLSRLVHLAGLCVEIKQMDHAGMILIEANKMLDSLPPEAAEHEEVQALRQRIRFLESNVPSLQQTS